MFDVKGLLEAHVQQENTFVAFKAHRECVCVSVAVNTSRLGCRADYLLCLLAVLPFFFSSAHTIVAHLHYLLYGQVED